MISISYNSAVTSGCHTITANSRGLDDAGCAVGNKVECSVVTLNGVVFKPFGQLYPDGAERGLALMLLNTADCTVVGIAYDI